MKAFHNSKAINLVVVLLQMILVLPFGAVRFILMTAATTLFTAAQQLMQITYARIDPIDPRNKDRLITSFTDEECWDYFRTTMDVKLESHHV